jgi:hypothetical protein
MRKPDVNTLRPEFQEAFVKHCFDQGLSEDLTAELLYTAHLQDALANSPDFAAGFKSAQMQDALSFVPTSAQGGAVGSGIGATLGGIAGNVLGGRFKGLGRAAGTLLGGAGGGVAGYGAGSAYTDPGNRSMAGGALGAGTGLMLGSHMPGPWWMKGLGALGGATLGGVGGIIGGDKAGPHPVSMPGGPRVSGPFVNDYLKAPSPSSGVSSSGNPYTMPSEIAPETGGAGASGIAGDIQGISSQVNTLNTSLTAARAEQAKALNNPGLQGSVAARSIQARIEQLEKQKQQMLSSSNSMLGRMRGDQATSLGNLDSALGQTDQALAARQQPAGRMDSWLRSEPQGGVNRTLYRLWNRATGADQQAAQMNSEQQNLQTARQGYQTQRDHVQGLLGNIY